MEFLSSADVVSLFFLSLCINTSSNLTQQLDLTSLDHTETTLQKVNNINFFNFENAFNLEEY